MVVSPLQSHTATSFSTKLGYFLYNWAVKYNFGLVMIIWATFFTTISTHKKLHYENVT